MYPLWMSIAPDVMETQIMLTMGGVGTLLRARFPLIPKQPEGLGLFLRGIAAWFGQPFCAVLDADAQDVWEHPERWAQLLGDLDDASIRVEWRGHSEVFGRDRLAGTVGDFRKTRRLLTYAATGQK
ncbi:MAG: hypothetical protein GY854_00275 [Deltaproteobacteria bacterium]|nr:hypothetical protein [Deltaproteobacteria bacterium]